MHIGVQNESNNVFEAQNEIKELPSYQRRLRRYLTVNSQESNLRSLNIALRTSPEKKDFAVVSSVSMTCETLTAFLQFHNLQDGATYLHNIDYQLIYFYRSTVYG